MADHLVQVSFHNGSGAEFSCTEEAAKDLETRHQAWLQRKVTDPTDISRDFDFHQLKGRTRAGGSTSSTIIYSTIAQVSIIELMDGPMIATPRPRIN